MGMFTKGLVYLLRDFCSWTSTHGVPHIGTSSSILLMLFWLAVVIACIFGFIVQFQYLMRKYYSFEINTETKLKFEERSFPVVTICNLNPWKREETANASEYTARLMEAYLSYNANADFGFSGKKSTARQQRATRLMTMANSHLISLSDATRNESGYQIESDLAYTIEDLVATCNYNAEMCSEGMLKRVRDPTYGYCLQFNEDESLSTSRAGPMYGLRLVIRTDQATYLPWVDSAGIQVAIHNMTDQPFPDVKGYAAGPGLALSYGLRYVGTSRQPPPYGDCSTRTDVKMSHYEGIYQAESCYRSCLQDEIIKKCGCYFAGLPYGQGSQHTDCFGAAANGSYGEISGKLDCIDSILDTNSFNVLTACDCPQMCEDRRFQVTMSTAAWPAYNFKHPDCREKERTGPWMDGATENNLTTCLEWYAKNTMFIEVFYERMNYQTFTESPAYSWVSLVSEVGGQIGLFLGMSIISVFEFLTLFILLVYYASSHESRKLEMEAIEEYVRNREAELAQRREEKRAARLRALYVEDEVDPPLPPKISHAE